MSEVKRYGSAVFDSGLIEMACGDYVTYSDYQKLVAENSALKSFGNKLDEMHNDLNGEGTGIQGRAEVACQQAALEAAMEEFDAIETPATDAAIAEIGAKSVDEYALAFRENTNMDFACNRGFYHGALDFAANLRAGRKG